MRMSRFGLPLVTASIVALSGCASGGGGGGGGEEGNPPRDNEHTRTAELYLTQAQTLGDTARYQEAFNAALNSILEDSTNALGYFQAGRAQVGLGDHVAADSLFDMAVEFYPGYDQDVRIEREEAWIELFNQAIGPLDAGNTEEGIRFLEAAEAMFSGQRPEALINLGVSYNNVGRTDDAIAAYGSALDVIRGPRMEEVDSATSVDWSGRELNVTFNRAQLLSMEERYDEAAAEYEAYLATSPGDVGALSSLAAVLSQAGMPDSAQAIYNNLLSGTGLGMREYLNIGVGLYNAADKQKAAASTQADSAGAAEVFQEAAKAFREVVEVAPENRDAVFNLAQSYYESEDWEALIPVAERLVALDGYNRDSYTILGQGLARIGDEQEAVRILGAGQELPFRFDGGFLEPRAAGGGSVTGDLVNNTLEAGTTVTVRVHFSGEDGAEIGATEIRVTVPEQGGAEPFRADLTSSESVMGYYFEVVSPR